MSGDGRKYREVVTVQKRTTTDSRGGQPVESWQPFARRRASVMATALADQVQHDQKVNTEDYAVELPFDAQMAGRLAKDLRVIWQNRAGTVTLNVLTIDVSQQGRGAEIVLRCRRDKA